MPNYRRNRVPGGTYFFTVALQDRRSSILVDHIDRLRAAVRRARELMPFHIDPWVVLPDHMHALWTLPERDSDYPRRWQTIKLFSRHMPLGESWPENRYHRGERGIWQRRYWEHTICDDRDYAAHMDYIHFNPVKHGVAEDVADWPYSSFQRCVRLGLYPPYWAGPENTDGAWGERA